MWNQIVDCENESFRDAWVHKTLSTLRTSENQSLLDVGAGLQPYRKYAEEIGFRYKAHDFSMYRPESELAGGLQNSSWHYPAADFNCDILNIPSNSKYEIVICTEVLEHVPDPVAAFDKMVSLLAPDGLLVVTVPLMSLMHQAPYWFQSGLSPQWFEYRSKQRQIEIKELSIYGDYADYLEQEILRAFGFFSKIRRFPRGRKRLKRFFRKNFHLICLSPPVLVLYLLAKIDNCESITLAKDMCVFEQTLIIEVNLFVSSQQKMAN